MMQSEMKSQLEHKVDALFSAAIAQYPTYETMVHRGFCKAMLGAFSDPETEEGKAAYEYARDEYRYLGPEEIAADDASNKEDGICSHGLDWMTCPCGCFEWFH